MSQRRDVARRDLPTTATILSEMHHKWRYGLWGGVGGGQAVGSGLAGEGALKSIGNQALGGEVPHPWVLTEEPSDDIRHLTDGNAC